jgi:transcriptional regulator with XRE-family HTH domain
MNLKEFGEYFSEVRKREGYKSQRDLAEKSGVSNATISRLEAGMTKPTPEVLRELANCFVSVTYEELMQKAGYSDLLTALREDGAVYTTDLNKLGPIYEGVIQKLKFRKIYVRDNNLAIQLSQKNIQITSVANNLEADAMEFLEILEGKRNISLADAVKLCKFYRISCLNCFKLEEVNNSTSEQDNEILMEIDTIIQDELVGKALFHNHNKYTRAIQNIQITYDELEYLGQCLRVYRELNLKPFKINE